MPPFRECVKQQMSTPCSLLLSSAMAEQIRVAKITPKRKHKDLMCAEDIDWLVAADVITPDDVFDVLEEDVRDADMVLWVGISFQQSASTAYFRRVRGYLQVCAPFTRYICSYTRCRKCMRLRSPQHSERNLVSRSRGAWRHASRLSSI